MNHAIKILSRIEAGSTTAPCLVKGLDPVCWVWTRALSHGYGVIGVGKQKTYRTHRLAYVLLVGDPEELELDHLCRRPACWNPAHLEPVTHAVNMQRGRARVTQHGKTHCPHGHPYTGSNLYVYRGKRNCRECSRSRSKAWRATPSATLS